MAGGVLANCASSERSMFSKAQLGSVFTKYLSVLENSFVKFSMVILSYFPLLIIFASCDVIFTFPFGGQLFFYRCLDFIE